MRSEEWWCAASNHKAARILEMGRAHLFSKLAALFNLCAALRFNPLPLEGGGPSTTINPLPMEGGGPEGRGLAPRYALFFEEGARRAGDALH